MLFLRSVCIPHLILEFPWKILLPCRNHRMVKYLYQEMDRNLCAQ